MTGNVEKKKYARSAESTEREKHMRALALTIVERLGSVTGSRKPRGMQFVDVQPASGSPMVVWVKCAWRPGKDGNCAVQMAFPGKKERAHTAVEVVTIVTEKAERAMERGATHVLFLAADASGLSPLGAYLLPVSALGTLTQEAVEVDERLTQNGASPSFYVTAGSERQAALVEVVRKHALDLLAVTDIPTSTMDAIEDLDAWPEGTAQPIRQSRVASSYQRDPAVRAHVLKRAEGRCEYCGVLGFLMANGQHYLEAHHIIALANQGADTLGNVIALCPGHHREAHYGARREALEVEMVNIVQALQVMAKS